MKLVFKIFLPIIVGISMLTLVIYWSCQWFFPIKKTYYIPQIETYITTINSVEEDRGYIIFSNKEEVSISDSVDYVSVGRYAGNLFLFEFNNKEDVYIIENKNVIAINQVNRVFYEPVTEKDTIFFNVVNRPNSTSITYIRSPYFGVLFSEFLDYVSIKESENYVFVKIKPR